MFSVSSGMDPTGPDSKEGLISLQCLNSGSSFISQNEGMSESTVETLEKAVGVCLMWTEVLNPFDPTRGTRNSMLHTVRMSDTS